MFLIIFGMLIGETKTFLSCNQNKRHKVLKYETFVIILGDISFEINLRPISHYKMTYLAINCVTMNDSMDTFYGKTDLSDVTCEECSKLSGRISKANFEEHQSVLNPPMQLRIFLQRSGYNFERDEYYKNKTKITFPAQYSMSFPCKHSDVLYTLVSIKLHIVNNMNKGHYV